MSKTAFQEAFRQLTEEEKEAYRKLCRVQKQIEREERRLQKKNVFRINKLP